MSVGLYAAMFYIPLFLQNVQGLGALDAGLVLLPQGIVMAVLMPIAGQLYDKFGARWLAIIGLTAHRVRDPDAVEHVHGRYPSRERALLGTGVMGPDWVWA
jgi:MFS family permease